MQMKRAIIPVADLIGIVVIVHQEIDAVMNGAIIKKNAINLE